MVRLVLFDIDGTLIHTKGAGVQAFGRAFASEFGVNNGTEGVKFAGRTDTSLARELFVRHGIEATAENFRRFFDCYVFWLDRLLADCRGGCCLAVEPFLAALRRLSSPPALGLLTGNIRLGAEIKLRRFDLWESFVTGAFGDDHEDRDRIAAIARDRGSQLFGRTLSGEEILVVGDTPHDVRCGRAIGARVLAVATGGATAEQLIACEPDWMVRNLGETTAETVCA